MKKLNVNDIIGKEFTNVKYGYKYIVLEYLGKHKTTHRYLIEFLETGSRKNADRTYITNGTITDDRIKKIINTESIVGKEFINNKGLAFVVTDHIFGNQYTVKFKESGHKYQSYIGNIKRGTIEDSLESNLHTRRMIFETPEGRHVVLDEKIDDDMYIAYDVSTRIRCRVSLSELKQVNRNIYGIASTGMPLREVAKNQRLFERWKALIKMVKNSPDKTICDRWLVYKNFLEDLTEIGLVDKLPGRNIQLYPYETEFNINTIYIKEVYAPKGVRVL